MNNNHDRHEQRRGITAKANKAKKDEKRLLFFPLFAVFAFAVIFLYIYFIKEEE
jgi:hypothetical protein